MRAEQAFPPAITSAPLVTSRKNRRVSICPLVDLEEPPRKARGSVLLRFAGLASAPPEPALAVPRICTRRTGSAKIPPLMGLSTATSPANDT
jgi:hypothetical protein